MANKRDYYDVLGVSKDADEKEIKKAYRKQAMKFHPDRNNGDKAAEEKFKEANEAYETLSDSNKKANYDRFGHNGPQGFGGGSSGGFGGSSGFEDIFSSFFGGGGSRGGRTVNNSGSDLRYNLEITLEEAAFGAEKEVSYKRNGKCGVCNGTGGKPDSKKENCPVCKGKGEIREVQRSIFGEFVNSRTCDHCHGTGKVYSEKCGTCNGSGIAKEKIKKSIKVPAGIEDGQKMRLRGYGEAGKNGGEFGDLFIYIYVKQHEIFERVGNDVACEVPISFATAVIGGEIEVPTLDGTIKMKIPAGTQSEKVFRLRDKGISYSRGYGKGDQLVKIVVETPTNLTEKQKDLLTQFDDSLKESNNSMMKGFFDKIAKTFKK